MYQRFLNNNDYLSIMTKEAVSQLIRGNEDRYADAEEAAESYILDYLSENYEIERVLAQGKNLEQYSRQVTYPAGSHFYYDGKVMEATRVINGLKAPSDHLYWMECEDALPDAGQVSRYSQRVSYAPGDIVEFNTVFYRCLDYNGPDYDDIRIPGVTAWEEVEDIKDWEPNLPCEEWTVVRFADRFYALIDRPELIEKPADNDGANDEDDGAPSDEPELVDPMDWTKNPEESDNWGLIGDYDPEYNEYELSDTEYVVKDGKVYYPVMNPNPDTLKEGFNIKRNDPRHPNIKKHMLRLAVFELHKLISPNNVSSARITDFETSIGWLKDAGKMRINPNLPRRIAPDNKPVSEFAVATFMRDYDPYKNPWHI